MRQDRHFVTQVPQPRISVHVPITKKGYWDLEIGSGDGEFSRTRAIQNPHRQVIAIEKTRNKFQKANLMKNKPSNLWLLHTNAVWWVTHFVPKDSLDNIFILYPNTYPKNKQANLRWVNRPFMSFLLERLKKGGHLEFRTNDKNYYQETTDKMVQRFPFMKCIKNEVLQNHQPETSFERKYIPYMPCWILQFEKQSQKNTQRSQLPLRK